MANGNQFVHFGKIADITNDRSNGQSPSVENYRMHFHRLESRMRNSNSTHVSFARKFVKKFTLLASVKNVADKISASDPGRRSVRLWFCSQPDVLVADCEESPHHTECDHLTRSSLDWPASGRNSTGCQFVEPAAGTAALPYLKVN